MRHKPATHRPKPAPPHTAKNRRCRARCQHGITATTRPAAQLAACSETPPRPARPRRRLVQARRAVARHRRPRVSYSAAGTALCLCPRPRRTDALRATHYERGADLHRMAQQRWRAGRGTTLLCKTADEPKAQKEKKRRVCCRAAEGPPRRQQPSGQQLGQRCGACGARPRRR
jgi:hypothetical protein